MGSQYRTQQRFEELRKSLISTVVGPYVHVPDILAYCLGLFYFRKFFGGRGGGGLISYTALLRFQHYLNELVLR